MQSEVDYSLYEAINSKIDFISKLILICFFTQTQMTEKNYDILARFHSTTDC